MIPPAAGRLDRWSGWRRWVVSISRGVPLAGCDKYAGHFTE
jgi:hypothetical protein